MEIDVDVFETQRLRVEVDVIEIRYRDMGESSLTPDSVDQVFNAFDRVPISETDFLVGKGKRLFSWASIKQLFAPINHGHSYNSLSDRPTIPSISGLASQIWTSAGFVAQVPGKSLLSNDEIARLGGLGNYNDTELRQLIANRVIKEIGKSLLDDSEIARLLGLHNYDDSAVVAELAKKINKDETLTATEIQLLISNLVDSSPETLNTLRELADALGNDPHFATTVMTKIGEKVTAIAGKSLLLDSEIERLSHLVNYDDAALRLLIGEKVTAVAGKSLILDTEIERLSHLANYDDSAIRQLISGLKASDIAETTTRMWLTDLLKSQYDAAVIASHSHSNKSVLDQITQGVFDGWSGKLAATKAAIEGVLTGVITTHSHQSDNTKANSSGAIFYHSTPINAVGSISITGNTVTGSGTSFGDSMIGGRLIVNGVEYTVASRATTTSMTIAQTVTGTVTATNGNWTCYNAVIFLNGNLLSFNPSQSNSTVTTFFYSNGSYSLISNTPLIMAPSFSGIVAHSTTDAYPNNSVSAYSSTTSSTGAKDLGFGRNAAGVFEINNGTAGTLRDILVRQLRIGALNTAPASATDTGVLGEIRIDSNYIYMCVATNTWKRTALSTW